MGKLHAAVSTGDLSKVKKILSSGVDVNTLSEDGRTGLHFAAEFNFLEVAEFLLECGAEKDARTKFASTPLHIAAAKGNLSIVKLLVQRGHDLHSQDKYGFTVLALACYGNHRDCTSYLLAHGAYTDADRQDSYGKTPRDFAFKNGFGRQFRDDVRKYREQYENNSAGFKTAHTKNVDENASMMAEHRMKVIETLPSVDNKKAILNVNSQHMRRDPQTEEEERQRRMNAHELMLEEERKRLQEKEAKHRKRKEKKKWKEDRDRAMEEMNARMNDLKAQDMIAPINVLGGEMVEAHGLLQFERGQRRRSSLQKDEKEEKKKKKGEKRHHHRHHHHGQRERPPGSLETSSTEASWELSPMMDDHRDRGGIMMMERSQTQFALRSSGGGPWGGEKGMREENDFGGPPSWQAMDNGDPMLSAAMSAMPAAADPYGRAQLKSRHGEGEQRGGRRTRSQLAFTPPRRAGVGVGNEGGVARVAGALPPVGQMRGVGSRHLAPLGRPTAVV
jgi:hypothetical protein